MRSLRTTKTFEKDFKRVARQGRDMKRLKAIIQPLSKGEPLSPLRRDHALVGNFGDCRECHVQADWLLIYQTTETELALVRTGSHSDLFS
ncbi:MAG: type II toxin-antitoxin system YafQ family toxin [Salinisphaera sp.]|nr:type II toxin-antitoxin system YafQ family toxin [Salinisphaera sp.]